ncbi:MAG: AAA family ATPase [Candidatus Bathyarchaeota archaeon]|nr:AAA family ATPase [Candidatus Bathyarchaeota archaeon]
MKIAISGKGGVGKTTIAGIMARTLAERGFKVLAIDADPNANLGLTLGIPPEVTQKIVPVSENIKLIKEKTGVGPESYGAIFRLSFRVDDIVDNFTIRSPDGVNLLIMGTVKSAGEGCTCPANALIRALLRHILVKRDEFVIVDLEAGIEHLGRGTAEYVDCMLIVVEPNLKSIETAKKIYNLSRELKIKNIFVVGNKIFDKNDESIIKETYGDTGTLLGLIPYDEKIKKADAEGSWSIDFMKNSNGVTKVQELMSKIIEKMSMTL